MEKSSGKTRIYETYGVLLFDLVTLAVSYTLAMLLRYGSLKYFAPGMLHFNTCALLLLFTVLYYAVYAGREFLRRGYFVELAEVTKFNLVLFAVLAVVLFWLQKADAYSRLVSGYFLVINELLLYLGHILLKKIMRKHLRTERNQSKLLLVAEASRIPELVKNLIARSDVSVFLDTIAVWDSIWAIFF